MDKYAKFEIGNLSQFANIGSKPDGGFSIFEFQFKSLIYNFAITLELEKELT